mgnify:CR=1 FL=1
MSGMLDAPSAPASPEVEHDILVAAQRRERKVLAVDILQGEVGSFGALLDFLFGGFACIALSLFVFMTS